MTNKEYYGDKTLNEAISKYEQDLANGLDTDWSVWLNISFIDSTKGRFVRGKFFTEQDIEEKIRKMESLEVTGYLLEWKDEQGNWFNSEFEPEKGTDSNLWLNTARQDATDDWYENEVSVGFFKALGGAWFASSSDWDYRLGVDFNPTENPKADGVWEGLTKGGCVEDGLPWRVRKVSIKGELSDKAKEFFRRNPDITFEYAE